MGGAATNPTDIFRQEAADLLVCLESTLLDMERTPRAPGLVDTAFRALHTLKGSGAMFGWEALAAFTHHVENAFQLVRDGALPMTAELVSVSLAALDHIRVLLEAPDQADRVRGDAVLAALADLAGTSRAAGPGGAAAASGARLATGQDAAAGRDKVYRIRWRLGREALVNGTNPLRLLDALRALGPCTVVPLGAAVPPLDGIEPTGCYLGWDILVTTVEPRTAIEDVFIFVSGDSQVSVDEISADDEAAARCRIGEILVARGDISPHDVEEELTHQQRLGALLVRSGKVSPERLASALGEQRHVRDAVKTRDAAGAAGATIRVPAERLDALMDQVGELVIAQARLAQLAAADSSPLHKAISEDIQRLAAELRDTTMAIRMVPIGTLFGRFRRVVHDLSRELGKTVELVTEGEETELDKTMIEALNDPLVHMIRNAVDHGIESAARRTAAGKPPAGTLRLSAVHSGANVLITVEDDGKGLDAAAIRAKAEERGLLQPGQEASEAEVFSCIFQPGFSTAAAVTAVSGRGVGMDVVKRSIDSLRGTIGVESAPGQGAALTLKLPLTLAIIDGLLVRVGDERYVLPLSAVEECVELSPEADHRSEGRAFLNIRGEIVAFLRLRTLFGVPGAPETIQKVVIVGVGESRVGLVVDQVIGQHQTVIKSLSRLHRDMDGFSGATILGDGGVSLILDIPHLIKFARDRETARRAA